MKPIFTACIALVALPLAACSNMDIRPASQAPRTYVAAHNSDVGKCAYQKNRQHGQVVRCVEDQGGVSED